MLKDRNGIVIYSRSNPQQDPSEEAGPSVQSVLDLIFEFRLPLRFVERAQYSDIAGLSDDRLRTVLIPLPPRVPKESEPRRESD